MKKKHKPGVFFTNPSDEEVSKGTKNTIETFIESENDPSDTDHLAGDYRKIINATYDGDKKKKKRKI